MQAYQIYQQLPSEIVNEMLQFFRDEERDLYKSALTSLAQDRKLRPVFIQKKPLPAQFEWFHKSLKVKSCNMIGEHLLQMWLMKGKQALLTSFCDGVGIEHDGEGSVDELPETIDASKLKTTVDQLLEKEHSIVVALYLQVFNMQQTGGWDSLTELLAQDERLKLEVA